MYLKFVIAIIMFLKETTKVKTMNELYNLIQRLLESRLSSLRKQ